MNDILDFAKEVAPSVEPQAFDGIVAADATGPAKVIIPEFSADLTFGPAPWMPYVNQVGVFFPKRGDRALVIRTGDDSVWIAAWTPSTETPDHSF